MTQEYEDWQSPAVAHLLEPVRAGQRLAVTVRCHIKHPRPAFRYLAAHAISAALARPAEMQREASPRVIAEWTKSLELCGQLALVLYPEVARRKQRMILFEACPQA